MNPNYVYKALVKNVVDGDTVDLEIDMGFRCKSTHRVRLLRVDTYEMNSKDPAERQKALDAKNFLIGRILGAEVTVQTVKADSFGRYLADLWYPVVPGGPQINLNDELIATGLAVPYA